MEKVIHNVAEMNVADRKALEHLIGAHLSERQQVIISVVNLNLAGPEAAAEPSTTDVPAWWNVYEGLSEADVDRLDRAIRERTDLTRVSE